MYPLCRISFSDHQFLHINNKFEDKTSKSSSFFHSCLIQSVRESRTLGQLRTFCTTWCPGHLSLILNCLANFLLCCLRSESNKMQWNNSVSTIATNKVRLFVNLLVPHGVHLKVTHIQTDLEQNLQLQVC